MFVRTNSVPKKAETQSFLLPQGKPVIEEKQEIDLFGGKASPLEVSSSEEGEVTEEEGEWSNAFNKVLVGRDLFEQICEAAASNWVELHADEILERILSQHVMQPLKKRKLSESRK